MENAGFLYDGTPPAPAGKDNLYPAEYVHNENPSLVALGKKRVSQLGPRLKRLFLVRGSGFADPAGKHGVREFSRPWRETSSKALPHPALTPGWLCPAGSGAAR